MMNILLVDDDEDLRDAIESFLTDHGHAVRTARNGLDALAALAKGALPDLALIDVFMPEMDGLVLLATMRADARLADLPVIVMSAVSTTGVPEGTPFIAKTRLRDKLMPAIARIKPRPAVV